jgi:hypothetical protein
MKVESFMNSHVTRPSGSSVHRATTLVEVMISLAVIASLGSAISMVMNGSAGWSALASSEDALAEDVLGVWRTMNDDLSQSAWFIPDTTQSFGIQDLSNDRTLFYAPFVVQPTITGAPQGGAAQNPNLRIFNRSGGSDLRFEGPAVSEFDRCQDSVPGSPADRLRAPSEFAAGDYAKSYYARSQELVFVRSTSTSWNRATNAPLNLPSGARGMPPIERFPGAMLDWLAPSNHATVGALLPSGWQRSGSSWVQVTPSAPYGQVMEACFLYTAGGTTDLKLQLEQQVRPDFQTQDPANVRLFSYLVVPSPSGMGLGRLVRAYTAMGVVGSVGVDAGQRIASTAASSLIVDKVLSDNVVRVVFDSARHNDGLGINNVRATIYFAKMSEHDRGSPLVVRRAVTMVFALRAANSYQDKSETRALIKTSTAFASGAIPFGY